LRKSVKVILGIAGLISAFLLGSMAKTRVLFFGISVPNEEPTPAEEPVAPLAPVADTVPPATPVAANEVHTFVFVTERVAPQPQPRDLPSTFGWALAGVAALVGAAIVAALVIALWGYDYDQNELREELVALQIEHAVLEERHQLMIGACADTVIGSPIQEAIRRIAGNQSPEYFRAIREIDDNLDYAACISAEAVLDGNATTGP